MKIGLLWLLCSVITACEHHSESDIHRNLTRTPKHSCGTPSPTDEEHYEMAVAHSEWMKHNQDRDLQTTQYKIYVYWHVIEKTSGGTKWSSGNIDGAMKLLRKKFADSPFIFELRGTRRVRNNQWYHCTPRIERDMMKTLRVPGQNALNIYLCDVYNAQGYMGMAYYPPVAVYDPDVDGVLLGNLESGFGAKEVYATLLHEVGHWLGLLHTWEGQCNPGKRWYMRGVDEDYYISGDGVSDTPAHKFPATEQDGWWNCHAGKSYNTCPDNVPGVDPGRDPVSNIMNYLTADCITKNGHFTLGQVQRMVSQFIRYRNVASVPPPIDSVTTTTSTTKCKKKRRKCRRSRDCCGRLKCKASRCK